MNRKALKRWIVLILLLFINLFLIYRYLYLDKRYSDIRKIFRERGYGYTHQELKGLAWEYHDTIHKSLKLEFWVLVFFFILLVYVIYFLIKTKMNYNDQKRLKERKKFIDLDQAKQTELISHIFCDLCSQYRKVNFKEEKMLNGTMYALTNCSKCSNEIKIKSTWS